MEQSSADELNNAIAILNTITFTAKQKEQVRFAIDAISRVIRYEDDVATERSLCLPLKSEDLSDQELIAELSNRLGSRCGPAFG